ncbi:PaaX family transcriptional regulator [Egicoccus halophilus]|uniref:Phenylacetic acid degradation operon negative regulatory protein PaaX n=1 Tax=Egicoccus halophilus TaxID=1670830 RepID=A0A8J3ER48_9ACTN|nr:PaaX family transcriptional regulator C-terminal domain-containing protein [Egicoccus halophilus]GGI04157.1 phenylacetic acid degradation operon negative regulatory protein PaaX [Egicoccus halophilus]
MTDVFEAVEVGEFLTSPAPSLQPRALGRARSQRLLVTLLGDYWRRGRAPLPSAGLVRVLEAFDIAPANARATLSRLTQRGLLERTKEGRRTSYAPTERSLQLLERGAERIFAIEQQPPWDGTWTLVAFSLPLDDGDLRRLLRARLRWLTFWPIYDATWVTPHDRVQAVRDQLAELDISDALVLRSREVELFEDGRARLQAAWQLDDLAIAYQGYLQRYQPLHERARRGGVSPAEALVQRTELVDDWRRLVRDDPDLPATFLPDGFPRGVARQVFLTTYAALAGPAAEQFERLARGDG